MIKVSAKIAVVIPAYKLDHKVLSLIKEIPKVVGMVIVVDDDCPNKIGSYIESVCKDPRVQVVYNQKNLGVGGAVKNGYRHALNQGAEVIIKFDGDGQMNASEIPSLIEPLLEGKADYTKGNRFYTLESLKSMPRIRLFGNFILGILSKISTGYWNIFDPNNGFTAISSKALSNLDLEKISDSFFFESDMLFRLYCNRAVVLDVPMMSIYGDEKSNLSIPKVTLEFMYKHFRNSIKRFFYTYILRDASVASLELPFGILLLTFGVTNSFVNLLQSSSSGVPNNPGTVMLSSLAILTGVQFVLAFISHDVSNVPRKN
jgi:glycosyltransferase involved in cell wall biosynthesis